MTFSHTGLWEFSSQLCFRTEFGDWSTYLLVFLTFEWLILLDVRIRSRTLEMKLHKGEVVSSAIHRGWGCSWWWKFSEIVGSVPGRHSLKGCVKPSSSQSQENGGNEEMGNKMLGVENVRRKGVVSTLLPAEGQGREQVLKVLRRVRKRRKGST